MQHSIENLDKISSIDIEVPLVLDVDDALLRTDLLHETALTYLKSNPLGFFHLVVWLARGKAVLKRELSKRVALDVETLPVNDDLVAYAKQAHESGREVGLATAVDELLALRIGRRFDFVSFVIGSNGVTNLKGGNKAAALKERFPEGFAYAGDSSADLAVWGQADSIVLAGASAATARRAAKLGKPIEAVFARPAFSWGGVLRALRAHQWAKNMLVFVPLLLSGLASDPVAGGRAFLAFVAMSLMASGTYLINDLFDLADDRTHWSKRNRALAAGDIRIREGIALSAAMVIAALAVGAGLGLGVLTLLAGYMATTLAYSFYLKRQPILDAFTLGGLFTLRLGLGIVAVGARPSAWLLVFSMFLFASLSFAKRLTEIQKSLARGRNALSGRGYRGSDESLVLTLGVSAGMSAITIMVLYIMNDAYAQTFYGNPLFLWVFPAVLFLWVSRIWLLCHRQELNDDPVAFAVRDKVSLGLGGALGLAFLLGWLA